MSDYEYSETVFDFDQIDEFSCSDDETEEELDYIPDEQPKADYIELIMNHPSNSKDPQYLTYEACRIIAISRGIPNINEIFGTHEKRQAFLSQQLTSMPPATPLQVDLVTSLFEPTDNIGNMLQFMDKTEEFIQSKKDLNKPTVEQIKKAQAISDIRRIAIPKPALLNSKSIQDWINNHE